jgi:hypothetical protein
MTLEHSQQIFEKTSNIKFHENSSRGRRVVPCGRTDGQTDRHDEANSRFSEFCDRAYTLNATFMSGELFPSLSRFQT